MQRIERISSWVRTTQSGFDDTLLYFTYTLLMVISLLKQTAYDSVWARLNPSWKEPASPTNAFCCGLQVNGGHIGWSSWAFQRWKNLAPRYLPICAKTDDSICGCYRFFKGWRMWLYPCLVGWVCLCAGHMPMLVNLILMCVGYFYLTKLLISYDFSCFQCLTVDSPTMTLPTRPLPRTSRFTAKDLARQLTPRRCQRRSMQRSRNEWTKNRTCLSTAP